MGKVIGTNPPANQTSAITNVITIIVGSGPATKQIPDVAGQSVEEAEQNLNVYGFTKFSQASVDSPKPAGSVIATNPPAGTTVPIDSVIELQVSKGNQFVMPDLSGMFWTDAEPRLRALGWTGSLDKGARRGRRRFPAQPGRVSESARRCRGEPRRHCHAEVRSVVPASTGRCGRIALATSFSNVAPVCRRAPIRSRPASWPASGARPRSGSTRGGTGHRESAARCGELP